jgi:cation transport regulator ChaC
VVFRAASSARERILEGLDFREQGGYAREWHEVALHATPEGVSIRALVYRATSDNANFLGPASGTEIARQVSASTGPSGRNDTYVLELDRALRAEGIRDPHVAEVASQLHVAEV